LNVENAAFAKFKMSVDIPKQITHKKGNHWHDSLFEKIIFNRLNFTRSPRDRPWTYTFYVLL
jgi:hypothetical protein